VSDNINDFQPYQAVPLPPPKYEISKGKYSRDIDLNHIEKTVNYVSTSVINTIKGNSEEKTIEKELFPSLGNEEFTIDPNYLASFYKK
jgi:hypothetical protein